MTFNRIYTLNIGAFSGNTTYDALNHNNTQFSTYDHHNIDLRVCDSGGWWFNDFNDDLYCCNACITLMGYFGWKNAASYDYFNLNVVEVRFVC